MEVIRIPKERIAVLIGHDGKKKREIQQRSGIRLRVDSETGEVWMDTEKEFDPLLRIKVRNIIKAIGRGFSPEHAFKLFQDDTVFELVDIRDYVGKRRNQVERVRARIIGKRGKTRTYVENLTNTHISIYGNTVGIIGDIFDVQVAHIAMDMLLNGARHGTVYSFLEGKKREMNRAQMNQPY